MKEFRPLYPEFFYKCFAVIIVDVEDGDEASLRVEVEDRGTAETGGSEQSILVVLVE